MGKNRLTTSHTDRPFCSKLCFVAQPWFVLRFVHSRNVSDLSRILRAVARLDFGRKETGLLIHLLVLLLACHTSVWIVAPRNFSEIDVASGNKLLSQSVLQPVSTAPTPSQRPSSTPTPAKRPTPAPTPKAPPKPPPPSNTEINPNDPAAPKLATRFRGSYQIDLFQSDDPQEVLLKNLKGMQRDDRIGAYNDVADYLKTPTILTLDYDNDDVTIISNGTWHGSVKANGLSYDRIFKERAVAVSARFFDDKLTITVRTIETSSVITLRWLNDGKSLRVDREIHFFGLQKRIAIRSLFHKLGPETPEAIAGAQALTYFPYAARLIAIVDSDLSSVSSRRSEHFRMIVEKPDYFKGAIIDGYANTESRGENEMYVQIGKMIHLEDRFYPVTAVISSLPEVKERSAYTDEGAASSESVSKHVPCENSTPLRYCCGCCRHRTR